MEILELQLELLFLSGGERGIEMRHINPHPFGLLQEKSDPSPSQQHKTPETNRPQACTGNRERQGKVIFHVTLQSDHIWPISLVQSELG